MDPALMTMCQARLGPEEVVDVESEEEQGGRVHGEFNSHATAIANFSSEFLPYTTTTFFTGGA